MTQALAPSERDDGFPEPRKFQIDAHNQLRQGFREGHKNQLIMAPTGAGKTYLGLRICNEAIQRGKRAVFLCDRTTLINQTSRWLTTTVCTATASSKPSTGDASPDELLQIASVQTIAKREFWPKMDVLVVDEAHTTYKAWTEFAQNTGAAVIGLSATPFTVGLGKIFTNLINATTMYDLTQNGVLVPMRIFSCHKPDMTGAATAGGEWTDKAAEERGMAIIGDVVADWAQVWREPQDHRVWRNHQAL
jgi:DNA repair protein RadD